MNMFQQTNEGITFKVKVIPKAFRSEIVGWEHDELKVRVAAVPEKGEANAELLRCFADILAVGRSKVQLVQGKTSRRKRVCITGLTLEQIQDRLNRYINLLRQNDKNI